MTGTIQQTKSGSYLVVIPKDIITLYGFRKGDKVAFIEDRPGVMTIQKART